jgi:hypothetical protein
MADAEVQPPLGIHARYFPAEGQCRVWMPGQPARRQAKPTDCDGTAAAPAGSWILRRSPDQPDVLLVDYVDESGTGTVLRTEAYDAATGAYLPLAQPTLR